MKTKHYINDRSDRENLIKNVIGEGFPVIKFLVDHNHPNGNEWHTISSTGIITITNARTNKICSKLIARPMQLLRYVKNTSWSGVVLECRYPNNTICNNPYIPNTLIDIATEHQSLGYHTR